MELGGYATIPRPSVCACVCARVSHSFCKATPWVRDNRRYTRIHRILLFLGKLVAFYSIYGPPIIYNDT